jgi:2-C-methyl-D-erythritol 4-phosphate cytidylyltransferase
MQIAVIIPAAGVGRRFTEASGEATNKLELELAGKPVFLRSVELFVGRPRVAQVLLAVNPDTIDAFRFRWGDKLAFHGVEVVAGGRAERWETVLRAIERVRQGCTHIGVHDAARPLGSDALMDRLFDAAERHAAVIPALPVANTVKRVSAEPVESVIKVDPLDAIFGEAGKPVTPMRRVVETVDRRDLVEVQTPQVFDAALLRRAYAAVADGTIDPATITDDAGLVERIGEPVVIVEGEPTNFKITRPADAELAAALLAHRAASEAGQLARRRLFGDDED